MKTQALTTFIKPNALYQSSKKMEGEIHAGCFMYSAFWLYLRFLNTETIQVFKSNHDLSRCSDLSLEFQNKSNIAEKYDIYSIKEEIWCDATFSFRRAEAAETLLYGHLTTNIYGEAELLLVDAKTEADCFCFIGFVENKV